MNRPGLRKVARAGLFPVRRLLDPRFADTHRRLEATKTSLHQESNLTRWVLERDVTRLEQTLNSYAATSTEALSFVGTQLRELQDEVHALSAQISELEERLLAAERAGEPRS